MTTPRRAATSRVTTGATVSATRVLRRIDRSGVSAELESHDMSTREVSFYEVTSTEEDVYLARGDVAFDDGGGDGTERRIDVRCTVRVENGEMQSPSVTYNEPIRGD